MYLLDTNVVSLLAPSKRRTPSDEKLAAWIVERSSDLWLSVITLAEIEDGIANAKRTGATKKAGALAEWWGEIRHYYSSRILPLDLETATITGQLMTVARAAGISPGFEDIAIAATGMQHDLIVLTDNEKDFRPLGIRHQNPFIGLPE
ncbi:type II toxin-antitoxin system VapC family toxin [Mesorhizobium sp. M7A.F.Ca.CA.001.09.2.1]|uniref:PilT protein domain protein n=3 Tax=Mesorhizobium TaxID=68287 RepID=E8TNZ6_MESCW|nr:MULTISPECIES: type II toxin-antitoxin system VapC family toxin [Mesorhizobium]RUY46662.1 type II toxin-antitoxin system VapC family toxin [Mesorhizobium sp. M7A.F.Ca.CA.001.13.2.1]RUZ82815.1 type II toxin-antitoxin system VapC family toxin [Mesorhizobium sp. M7A.F.Ca.US.003.02.2.1]ADV15425.1 PilT protein domain protein [Mesorhizobium ciceri biovar biserrulae WSM1271]AMX97542.1 twitching motility protein PilT [Mesorhizobium ciceri]ARP68153.1 PIN domain nuclease [Mesorhizobium sp. WSM1497]